MQLVVRFLHVCIVTEVVTQYPNVINFSSGPLMKDGMLLRNNLFVVCLNPFQAGHKYNCNALCKHCGRNHHELLHRETVRNEQNLAKPCNQVTCTSASTVLNKCLLPIARVKLFCNNKYLHTTALLDSGSNCNLITKELARKLKLNGFSRWINV